jgi:hypothetical protein
LAESRWRTGDDENRKPRTLADLNAMAKKNKFAKGFNNTPLFPFIEFTHVLLDELHSLLRLSDLLLNLLAADCKKDKGGFDRFSAEMRRVGIRFQFYSTEEATVRWTPIDGDKRIKMLEAVDLRNVYSNTELGARVTQAWRDLLALYRSYSSWEPDVNLVQTNIDRFMLHFTQTSTGIRNTKSFSRTSLFCRSDVTPYLHAVAHHFIPLIRRWGSLKLFSMSSLEAKNDEQQTSFFRTTMRGGGKGRKNPLRALVVRELLLFSLSHQPPSVTSSSCSSSSSSSSALASSSSAILSS